MKKLILVLTLLLAGCDLEELSNTYISASTFEYSKVDHITMEGDGFTFTDIDLRAIVAFPADDTGLPVVGKYPLFIIQHGQHSNTIENHKGFTGLLKRMAENGYIAVSIDAHDLLTKHPKDHSVFGNGYAKQRAQLFQEHINYLKTPGKFIGKMINFNNITLAGHSRGGAAAYEAAKIIDGVTGVVGIAPSYADYSGIDVPIFVIVGSADNDIVDFNAFQMYSNRNAPVKKALAYVRGANHNWFNSMWIEDDSTELRTDYISHNDQTKIVEELVLSFMTSKESQYLSQFNIDYSYREANSIVLTDGIDYVQPIVSGVNFRTLGNYFYSEFSFNRVKEVQGSGDVTFTIPAGSYKSLSFRVAQIDSHYENLKLIVTTDSESIETTAIPVAYDLVPAWGLKRNYFMSTITVDLTGNTSTVTITTPYDVQLYLDDVELL